ncbi:hypothetical protein [Microbacterium telephonicum]|uniref:hypothetical protein n=1 Tax=Microbacterium telephonicum TaxID=1714841 RepID=UPI0011C42F1D|nr:hypothetical protein [Microbacterium telephonicum]
MLGDWFSPFGAELQIDVILGAGVFSERVPMGRFVIESVPDATDREILFDGRPIRVGQSFGLNLKDPLMRVARDEFPFPTAPRSTSAWQEIQAVSGMPVIRNASDVTLAGGTVYEGEKAAQLSKLFDLLDAWPQVDASGTLTARQKTWPGPVGAVRGVVDAPISMDSSKTYNRVVVEGKTAGGDPIYGVADVTEGFLRVSNVDGTASPFGVSVYRYASDQLYTQSQVDAYARGLLQRVSRIRGVTRQIVEPFNPLRELGDVLTFEDGVVRVASVTHDTATTQLVVEVPDAA